MIEPSPKPLHRPTKGNQLTVSANPPNPLPVRPDLAHSQEELPAEKLRPVFAIRFPGPSRRSS